MALFFNVISASVLSRKITKDIFICNFNEYKQLFPSLFKVNFHVKLNFYCQ